jgi:hypothetical protein
MISKAIVNPEARLAKLDAAPLPSPSGPGRRLFPLAMAVLFGCVTLVQAHVKLLSGEEFVTFWIGQQQSFAGIWRALEAGADDNPPLMHVLNWWSTSLFGTGSIAVRLPSILAMALGLTCLWFFLRRRVEPVYAAAGCLALMSTRGLDYAYDARPYSLLMGFALAALLLWSRSVEATGVRRLVLLSGLAVALAAGISSHYCGVLMVFPIALGELRSLSASRPFRTGAWVAMAVASLPLLAYRKLIPLNVVELGRHTWNQPHLSLIPVTYLVIGLAFAIWGAALLARTASRRVAMGVVALLFVGVLAREAASGYILLHQRHAFFHLRDVIERTAAPGEPVVVGDLLLVLPLYGYGSPALRQQLICPIDFEAMHRSEGDDSGEQALWGGRNGVFPVPIAPPSTLLREPQERVLVASPNGWLARDLQVRGYELQEVSADIRWDRLGGVFTPLAQEQTRILLATPRAAQ